MSLLSMRHKFWNPDPPIPRHPHAHFDLEVVCRPSLFNRLFNLSAPFKSGRHCEDFIMILLQKDEFLCNCVTNHALSGHPTSW